MKISVILGHPYENSFNSAVAKTIVDTLTQKKHKVMFHDLYRENFNPVIPENELINDFTEDDLVKNHQLEIKEADGIIIVHPNWWGQPPAVLKGWIDRVLRENIAYAFQKGDKGGGLPAGLFKAKTGLVFNTSNTPEKRENEVFGDPLNRLWKDCVFGFCGITTFDRIVFRVMADSSKEERMKWLKQTRDMVNHYFM
jgi:putative NADPH-quinone reductase